MSRYYGTRAPEVPDYGESDFVAQFTEEYRTAVPVVWMEGDPARPPPPAPFILKGPEPRRDAAGQGKGYEAPPAPPHRVNFCYCPLSHTRICQARSVDGILIMTNTNTNN